MIYLLDTNACVVCLNKRSARLKARLEFMKPSDIAVCSVVKAELHYGAMKSQNPQRTLTAQQRFLAPFVSLPFDDPASTAYGEVRAELERLGRSIGGNDLMIAAIALSRGLTLVTHNAGEFRRVPNLRLEDWETE